VVSEGSSTVTPDGQHLAAADGDSDQATMIDVAGRSARHVGVGGYSPDAVAVSGSQAFVLSNISGTVIPLAAARGRGLPRRGGHHWLTLRSLGLMPVLPDVPAKTAQGDGNLRYPVCCLRSSRRGRSGA
jgi:hypothetical protein